MNDHSNTLKTLWTIVAGSVTGLIAGLNPLVWGLFAFQVIDIISGLVAATSWTSAQANAGMKKKVMMWLMVLTGHLIRTVSPVPIDFPVDAMIAGCFCVVEIISIKENAAKVGVTSAPLEKAMTFFEKVTVMKDGSVETVATTQSVTTTPADPKDTGRGA